MRKIIIQLFIFTFFAAVSYSQDLNIAIYSLAGEKSKDSHSTEESFAISNTSVAYSVKYSGHRSNKQEDMNKICTFTEQDIKNIRQTIETKELNVNDSIFSESSKSKSIEYYVNISMEISLDGQPYKIKINGDVKELEDNRLYKNTMFFITMLRKMVEGCK